MNSLNKGIVTKHPKLNITQKQNTQDNKKVQIYKMSKVKKCPKLQNVRITKCPKLQNVESYKMSKMSKMSKAKNYILSQLQRSAPGLSQPHALGPWPFLAAALGSWAVLVPCTRPLACHSRNIRPLACPSRVHSAPGLSQTFCCI